MDGVLRPVFSFAAAFVLGGCAALRAPDSDTFRLAHGGYACADIVIAADADKAARFGAAELAWHLREITGADFRIVRDDCPPAPGRGEIRLGRTRRTKANPAALSGQRFLVDITPETVELVGNDAPDKTPLDYVQDDDGLRGANWPDFYAAQGTLYAVYDFLERVVGVRWTDATVCGTVLPHDPDLAVSVGCAEREPFVLSRNGGWSGGRYETLLWPSDSPQARRYRDLAYGPRGAASDEPELRQRLFLLRHRIGGVRRAACHSFAHRCGPDTQLCYEDPAVVSQTVAEVRAYFDDPDSAHRTWGDDVCCLEPMDNTAFCTCARCRPWYEPARAGECSEHSTYWFRFVNRVARELKKSHPDKRLSTLAYLTHEGLPTGFDLEDNVAVWFCLFNARMPYKRKYPGELERLAAWRKNSPTRPLGLWLYNTFPHEFAQETGFHEFPAYFSHEAVRQFRLIRDCGVREGAYCCGMPGGLESYMQLEQLVDPSLDVDALVDGYLSKYGAAAPAMRRFHDLCERRYCDRRDVPADISPTSEEANWRYLGTPETMATLADCLAEAERRADTPRARLALALFKLDVWAYMNKGFADYRRRMALPCPSFAARRVPAADGDVARPDWASLRAVRLPLYRACAAKRVPAEAEVRLARDERWLYLEAQVFSAKKAGALEVQLSARRALPMRVWRLEADGALSAVRYGETGPVWCAASADAFGAKAAVSSEGAALRAVRLAIPLAQVAAERPAEKLWMNLFWRGADGGLWTLVSDTQVQVTDRLACVSLAGGGEEARP